MQDTQLVLIIFAAKHDDGPTIGEHTAAITDFAPLTFIFIIPLAHKI